jgi:predicted dehydrogenase
LTGQVIHIFDLVRHFGGDVGQVYSTYREVTPTQFGFLINLVFRNGAIGMLNLNSLEAHSGFRDMAERMAMAGLENWVQVEDMLYLTYQPKNDWLEVPGLDIGRLHHTWRPTGPAARKTDELIGYRGELAHFAECVVSGQRPTPDLWDGAAALQLTEAVWQSARTGDVVLIPTIRPT